MAKVWDRDNEGNLNTNTNNPSNEIKKKRDTEGLQEMVGVAFSWALNEGIRGLNSTNLPPLAKQIQHFILRQQNHLCISTQKMNKQTHMCISLRLWLWKLNLLFTLFLNKDRFFLRIYFDYSFLPPTPSRSSPPPHPLKSIPFFSLVWKQSVI